VTSVPAPRTSRAPRRALGVALPGGALGAALVLVAAGQNWGEGTTAFGGGSMTVTVTGSDVTGLPGALAMVGLAALFAVFAVRRAGRTAVAALLALCGAGITGAALLGAGDTGALQEEAAATTGLAESAVEQVTYSGWPYAAAVGGVLLLIAGVLALRYGRDWPAMGGRYERAGGGPGPGRRRPGTPEAPVDPERPEELWKALDRGEDPTGGDGDDPSRPT
jgi:uncharacterized membrane protein (TIGR02234 family)